MNATIILDSRVVIDSADVSNNGNRYYVEAGVHVRDLKFMTKQPVTMVLTDGDSLEEIQVTLETYEYADDANAWVRQLALVFEAPTAVVIEEPAEEPVEEEAATDIAENWLEEQEIPEKPKRKRRTPRKSNDEKEG